MVQGALQRWLADVIQVESVQVRSDDLGKWQVFGYQVEIAKADVMGLWHHSLLEKEHPKREARFKMTTAGEKAVIEKGGTMPAVFHGADTTAVKAFMDKKIKFTDIPVIIQNTMDAHEIINDPDLAAILDSEKWAEEYAKTLVRKR